MEYICQDCIGVKSVREEVERLNKGNGQCCYCLNTALVANRSDIFLFIENNFFESLIPINECSQMEQTSFWGGSDDLGVSEIWEHIQNLELGNEQLENDLTEYLSKDIPESENLFVIDDGTLDENQYEAKWQEFIKSISHGQRFFNSEVKLFLDDLFSILHCDNLINNDICSLLEPNVSLFRARVANSKAEREAIISNPSNQLGPVPPTLASEQRMTPAGISALYAATDRETCFSEVRAITGDMVISGEFVVNRAIKLLDIRKLEQLSQTGFHLFEPNFRKKSHKSQFLRQLMFLLSRPASNRKNSKYLETQVVFEYFRVNFYNDISGLVFSSVQTGLTGVNVVLFPESSDVNTFQYESGLDLNFSEWHQPELGLYFYTKKAEEINSKIATDSALNFVSGSLKLHYVEAVKTVSKEQNIYISHHEK